jgi:hypothetical protein
VDAALHHITPCVASELAAGSFVLLHLYLKAGVNVSWLHARLESWHVHVGLLGHVKCKLNFWQAFGTADLAS